MPVDFAFEGPLRSLLEAAPRPVHLLLIKKREARNKREKSKKRRLEPKIS